MVREVESASGRVVGIKDAASDAGLVSGTSPGDRSGETATTLILVGLILQAIEVFVLLVIGLFLLIVPLLGLIFLVLAFFGIIWLILVYVYSYERAKEGYCSGAKTPTLVFGILSLLSVGFISGILYIIAYAKLGDAEAEGRRPVPAWGAPPIWGAPPMPPGGKFCPACGRPNALGAAFCVGCGGRLP